MEKLPKRCQIILDIRRKIPEKNEKIRNFLWCKTIKCAKKDLKFIKSYKFK